MKFFRIAVIFLSHSRFLVRALRSAHQARTFIIKCPARDQELHGDRVIASPEPMLLVEAMRRLDGGPVDFNAEPRAGTILSRCVTSGTSTLSTKNGCR